jgi:flagellar basal body-associated protein FliL
MQSNKGNALISIIVIILVLAFGAVYFWNVQKQRANEIRKQQESGFDYSFLSDDAGEYSVIEADIDVRTYNDLIDQTTFDESLY